MRTYKERLCAGLVKLGWTEDKADRSKYTAFTKPGNKNHAFVGAAGALRLGECASRSFSIGDPTRQTTFYKAVLDAAGPEPTSTPPAMCDYIGLL